MSFGKTSRENNSRDATIDYAVIHAEGAFRYVSKGTYTSGDRMNEACVGKWFKTGCVYESHYFDADISTVLKAIELIEMWNASKFIDRMIRVNLPTVWQYTSGGRIGSKILVKPFIQDYEKFNSNSGWNATEFPWGRAMQALSHYSYHASGGNFLLCDLQGGSYQDGIVLTDPVILSQTPGQYHTAQRILVHVGSVPSSAHIGAMSIAVTAGRSHETAIGTMFPAREPRWSTCQLKCPGTR